MNGAQPGSDADGLSVRRTGRPRRAMYRPPCTACRCEVHPGEMIVWVMRGTVAGVAHVRSRSDVERQSR